MIKTENISVNSELHGSNTSSSKSSNSSLNSLNKTSFTNTLQKSCEWLNELIELHYFPYNSCNSLTIYSYKCWQNQKKFLVTTKENNIKEIYFKTCFGSYGPSDDSSLEIPNADSILSVRSSVSSSTSNNNNNNNNQLASTISNTDDLNEPNNRKSSIINSTMMSDEKSNYSANDYEYSYLEPVLKVHKLSKIKNEALISSIDIFDVNNFSVLAITFVLKRKPEQFFLHVYCDFETNNLDLIKECEHEFELSSMPHRVTNLKYFKTHEDKQQNKTESFIFINCSQKTNILFSIDKTNRKFIQVNKIEEYFIELNNESLNDNCTSHDMKYLSSNKKRNSNPTTYKEDYYDRRLTAVGCQNGWLGVYLIDSIKNEILKFWEYENDSFITQLQLFTTKSNTEWSKLDIEKTSINLLALRSLEPTRIFYNVLYSEDDFEAYQDLEISGYYDLVTSSAIFDATFTGYNSIVLGTFGKAVLFFCPLPCKSEDLDKQTTLIQNDTINLEQHSGDKDLLFKKPGQKFYYELKREIFFKHSIMGLSTSLLSNNGALDLIVFTLNGVSVWQYDPDKIVDLINKIFEKKENLFFDSSNFSFKNKSSNLINDSEIVQF